MYGSMIIPPTTPSVQSTRDDGTRRADLNDGKVVDSARIPSQYCYEYGERAAEDRTVGKPVLPGWNELVARDL